MRNRQQTIQATFKIVFLYTTTLASIGFFKPIFLEEDAPIYKYLFGLLLIMSVLLTFFTKTRRKSHFDLPFNLIITSIGLSILSAYIFWNQSIIYSVFASLSPAAGYVFYYYLDSTKPNTHTLEKIIITIGLTFCILYLISFAIYPSKILHYSEATDRSVQRIFLNGEGFLFLFFFYSINKYSTSSSKKWLLYALLAFSCVLLNQTRVFIASTSIITLWYILRSQTLVTRIVTLLAFSLLLLYVSQLEIVKTLTLKTGEQLSELEQYIRYKAAEHYLTDFQQSYVTYILGNGWGYGDKTEYGKKIQDLQKHGYYISDLGLIGLYVHLGVLSILAYIIFFYKSMKLKLDKENQFLKMFVFFLLLAGATTSATFQAGYILPIVFTFYLLGRSRARQDQGKRQLTRSIINKQNSPEGISQPHKLTY
jgi:hypothetical protein